MHLSVATMLQHDAAAHRDSTRGALAFRHPVRGLLALISAFAPALPVPAGDAYEVVPDQAYVRRPSGPLKGDLYLPVGTDDPPVVVMIHGGGWRSGKRSDMARFARRLSRAGLAVFNIDYRLAPAHKFPAQLEDVRDAVRWLRLHSAEHRIDPGRIGAWGYSAGAHLALLLGTLDGSALPDAEPGDPSPRVSAVVAGAGPTDLREYPDNHYVVDLMPAHADAALLELASPVAAVSSDDPPVFLYHGRHDRIVHFRNSTNMYRALLGAGVEARLYEMRFGHVFAYLFGDGAVKAGIDFLKQNLRRRPRLDAADMPPGRGPKTR